jgi:hypothetical protein
MATPGANRAKVRKSSFSNTWMRSLGGNRNSATAARDSIARPSSTKYSSSQSPCTSNCGENIRASGTASWGMQVPITMPFKRCCAGSDWIT